MTECVTVTVVTIKKKALFDEEACVCSKND